MKHRGLCLVGQNTCYVPHSRISLPNYLVISIPGDNIIVAREMFEKYEIEIYDKKLLGEFGNFRCLRILILV